MKSSSHYFSQVPRLVDERGYVISDTANIHDNRQLIKIDEWDTRLFFPIRKCATCDAKILKRRNRQYCWVCRDLVEKWNQMNPNTRLSLDKYLQKHDRDYQYFHAHR